MDQRKAGLIMRGRPRPGHLSTPNDLFERAADSMQARREQPSAPPSDGFIFSGNRHDSFPRALLLDKRLTPLERNAWQVFRMLLNEDGITAFPTYDQLAPYLTSTPCATRASHETVARALTLLRLTRWISLVRRQRDRKSGRIVGNLYVLHDEPLTPFEAMQLDPEYLGLVSHALDHASRSIQRVGVHVLKEMANDPSLAGKLLPSRLQILTKRLSDQGWDETSILPPAVNSHDSEEGGGPSLRNWKDPSSESEDRPKTPKTNALPIPKTGRTVRHEENNPEIQTVPHARGKLRLPDRFSRLKAEQQSGALAALQAVDTTLHQAILDEWSARCATSSVRNPAGYLFGLIQRAMKGEFNAWAAVKASGAPSSAASARAADPDTAREHIDRLQSLLRLP